MVATKTSPMITIQLADDVSKLLAERASKAGQDVSTFAEMMLEKQLKHSSLIEILAPLRAEAEASGITDEEIETMVEEAREAMYREQHGKPSKVT